MWCQEVDEVRFKEYQITGILKAGAKAADLVREHGISE